MPSQPTRRRVLSWACLPLAARALPPSVLKAATVTPAIRTWSDLTERERTFIDPTLPPAGNEWNRDQAVGYVRRTGTRTAAYAALGMLLRDDRADRQRADAVIREVLRSQRVRPDGHEHGLWPKSPRRPIYDPNWREFVSLGLMAIRERYGEALRRDLASQIDQALVLAGEGSAPRPVPTAWTNVALMKALLLDVAGHLGGRREFGDQAAALAREIDAQFGRFGTFCEYNSPTYAGVDALTLAMWRMFAPSETLRTLGVKLETRLWDNLAEFYHPALGNLCGPYGRAYGLDMRSYAALAGLPIAISGTGGSPMPWPASSAANLHEQSYASLFAVTPPEIPPPARAQLTDFGKPRRLQRRVPYGAESYEVTALLEPTWMMGAAAGMPAHRGQDRPATIHWRDDQGAVSWLTFASGAAIDATIRGRSLEVAPRSPADEQTVLRAWIKATASVDRPLTPRPWKFPGMTLDVASPRPPKVQRVADPRFGSILEAEWTVPRGGVLTLTPQPAGLL